MIYIWRSLEETHKMTLCIIFVWYQPAEKEGASWLSGLGLRKQCQNVYLGTTNQIGPLWTSHGAVWDWWKISHKKVTLFNALLSILQSVYQPSFTQVITVQLLLVYTWVDPWTIMIVLHAMHFCKLFSCSYTYWYLMLRFVGKETLWRRVTR